MSAASTTSPAGGSPTDTGVDARFNHPTHQVLQVAIRYVLLDVEGTTSSLDYVHGVMYPFARAQLHDFVLTHAKDPEVRRALYQVSDALCAEQGLGAVDDETCMQALLDWSDEDRKHPALKTLQGLIWAEGFKDGILKAHIYPDVPPILRAWVEAGLKLGIYSSGSVTAQRFFFGHTEQGDLTPLLSHYFDTSTGPKREAASYRSIAHDVSLPAEDILFLSDVGGELDAAAAAGMHTTQVVRAGTHPVHGHAHVADFAGLRIPVPA